MYFPKATALFWSARLSQRRPERRKLQFPRCPRCIREAQCRGPEQRYSLYYIFLIVRYRRTSGSDLTATSPSAAAVAVMVIVVTYPIVRIIFFLLIRGSATAARDIDVPHPGAGSELLLPPGSGIRASAASLTRTS